MSPFAKFFFSTTNSTTLSGEQSSILSESDVWKPETDIVEVNEGLIVQMELAGVKSEDIEITLAGQILTVKGIRHICLDSLRKRYLQMEIRQGIFAKSLHLPIRIHESGAKASINNGILEIFLPIAKNSTQTVIMSSIRLYCD